MKNLSKITDEIPSTRGGVEEYIENLEKQFKPVKLQYNRINTLLTEAKNRLKAFKKGIRYVSM